MVPFSAGEGEDKDEGGMAMDSNGTVPSEVGGQWQGQGRSAGGGWSSRVGEGN